MIDVYAQDAPQLPKQTSALGTFRAKYAGIFEAQIVRPALVELREQRDALAAELDGETEATARRGLQGRIAKVDGAMAALSRASVEAQAGGLEGLVQALVK